MTSFASVPDSAAAPGSSAVARWSVHPAEAAQALADDPSRVRELLPELTALRLEGTLPGYHPQLVKVASGLSSGLPAPWSLPDVGLPDGFWPALWRDLEEAPSKTGRPVARELQNLWQALVLDGQLQLDEAGVRLHLKNLSLSVITSCRTGAATGAAASAVARLQAIWAQANAAHPEAAMEARIGLLNHCRGADMAEYRALFLLDREVQHAGVQAALRAPEIQRTFRQLRRRSVLPSTPAAWARCRWTPRQVAALSCAGLELDATLIQAVRGGLEPTLAFWEHTPVPREVIFHHWNAHTWLAAWRQGELRTSLDLCAAQDLHEEALEEAVHLVRAAPSIDQVVDRLESVRTCPENFQVRPTLIFLGLALSGHPALHRDNSVSEDSQTPMSPADVARTLYHRQSESPRMIPTELLPVLTHLTEGLKRPEPGPPGSRCFWQEVTDAVLELPGELEARGLHAPQAAAGAQIVGHLVLTLGQVVHQDWWRSNALLSGPLGTEHAARTLSAAYALARACGLPCVPDPLTVEALAQLSALPGVAGVPAWQHPGAADCWLHSAEQMKRVEQALRQQERR